MQRGLMRNSKVLALAALPIVILLMFGLDKWLFDLLATTGQNLNYPEAAPLFPVINLLYAILAVSLFSIMSKAKDWRVGVLYLFTGALLVLLVYLKMTGSRLTLSLALGLAIIYPLRGFWLLGSLLMAIGLQGILESLNPGLWMEREKGTPPSLADN